MGKEVRANLALVVLMRGVPTWHLGHFYGVIQWIWSLQQPLDALAKASITAQNLLDEFFNTKERA